MAIVRRTKFSTDGGQFRPGFTLTFDKAQVRQLHDELGAMPGKVNQAISGAINKILPKFRTRLVRSLVKVVNLRSAFIRRRMSIKRSTPQTLTGFLRIREKKIALIQFGAKQEKATGALSIGRGGAKQQGGGIRIKIYKNRPAELFPHMFINRGSKTGRLDVFKRAEEGGKLVPRYPIYTKYGPSMLTIIDDNPGIIPTELEVTADELQQQLNSQVDRFLKRRKIDR